MPLDAIALSALANELNNALEGGRIEKIHQPERDEIMLIIKADRETKRLVISASSATARIHLTEKNKENPAAPPMFCMLLRKHLTGAKIESVKTVGFDRIIDISLLCRNELGDSVMRHLMCEIMGRNSNIILTDGENKITDSIKHIDLTVSSLRNVLPGLIYFPPPLGDRINPEKALEEDFYYALKNSPEGREADRAICDKVMGISPLLSGECIYRACGDRNVSVGELDEMRKRKVAAELYNLFGKVKSGDFSPCIIKDGEKAIDISPFEISQYGDKYTVQKTESMSDAACEFYYLRDINASMMSRSSGIVKIITNNLNRAQKKLNILQKELGQAEKRDYYRICGDLITANIYKIQKGDKSVRVVNYYSENSEEIDIALDETKSPSQNANKYYSKYKKAKNTEIYAAQQIKLTVDEINYLESVSYSLSNATLPSQLDEIRKELVLAGYIKKEESKKKSSKQQKSAYSPLEFTYMGYTIFVGRNNLENDYLTLKMGRSNDLWLHTKNIAGSHTLIKYQGEEFPPKVIEYAAQIAAYYSKGKNSPYVEVDYCPVSHVKKPNGAKAGMVIYEGYSTAFVKPELCREINY